MGRTKTNPERYRIIIDIEPRDEEHAGMRRMLKAKAGVSWMDCELDHCDCIPVYMAWTSIAKALGQDPGPDIGEDMLSLVVTMTLQKCGVVPGDDRETVIRKITEAPDKVDEVYTELIAAAKTTSKTSGQRLHLAMARHMSKVLRGDTLAGLAADAVEEVARGEDEGQQ